MLFYQAALPLSSSTLRYVARLFRAHRRAVGVRWRRVDSHQQALMTLAWLRKGETYADLAAGFGVSTATVYRRVHETVDVLAARTPGLPQALRRHRRRGGRVVIVDGTLVKTDRVAADRPFYSGKHKCHGVNLQAVTDLDGNVLWISGAMRGAIHDTAAARIWMIPRHIADAGLIGLADKGYHALGPDTILTPHKGTSLTAVRKASNRAHARLRSLGERAFAQLKKWRILTRLRCSPHRATNITRAIHALNTHQTG